jgi:CPA1 family monovalent cation:H+ antiporter
MPTEVPAPLVALVALLITVPIVAGLARRLGLPYTVVLVFVGLAVAVLPVSVDLGITPDAAVSLLLPGLVFEAAYRLDGTELRRTFGGVALLAIPGVIISAGVVAVVLHLATGLPVEEAFLVGAMVSATDPVAVVSTMRQYRAPSRLVTLVDAESLFNDGTGVLVYIVALLALGGGSSLADDAWQFVAGLTVSVAIGLFGGMAIAWVAGRTRDHLIELSLTVLAAYGTYLVALEVHESGIIASVVAGVVLGTYGRENALTARARRSIDEVWEFIAFLFTAAVFLLIGVVTPLSSLEAAFVPIVWGVAAVLLGRALVVYGLLGGAARLERRIGLVPALPLAWLHVLNWAGLRGAVATALALSLPATVPDRALLQGTVFGIVLFTLVVQGTTIGRVLRRVGISGSSEPSGAEPEPGE